MHLINIIGVLLLAPHVITLQVSDTAYSSIQQCTSTNLRKPTPDRNRGHADASIPTNGGKGTVKKSPPLLPRILISSISHPTPPPSQPPDPHADPTPPSTAHFYANAISALKAAATKKWTSRIDVIAPSLTASQP